MSVRSPIFTPVVALLAASIVAVFLAALAVVTSPPAVGMTSIGEVDRDPFPVGVCVRVPSVNKRPYCVLIDPGQA